MTPTPETVRDVLRYVIGMCVQSHAEHFFTEPELDRLEERLRAALASSSPSETPSPATACPICMGRGVVSYPPNTPHDQPGFTSSSAGPFTCEHCKGARVTFVVRQEVDGYDATWWRDTYRILTDAIEKHWPETFVHDDDVAEVAIYAEAIERAGPILAGAPVVAGTLSPASDISIALCQVGKVPLLPGVLYEFHVMTDCAACAAIQANPSLRAPVASETPGPSPTDKDSLTVARRICGKSGAQIPKSCALLTGKAALRAPVVSEEAPATAPKETAIWALEDIDNYLREEYDETATAKDRAETEGSDLTDEQVTAAVHKWDSAKEHLFSLIELYGNARATGETGVGETPAPERGAVPTRDDLRAWLRTCIPQERRYDLFTLAHFGLDGLERAEADVARGEAYSWDGKDWTPTPAMRARLNREATPAPPTAGSTEDTARLDRLQAYASNHLESVEIGYVDHDQCGDGEQHGYSFGCQVKFYPTLRAAIDALDKEEFSLGRAPLTEGRDT